MHPRAITAIHPAVRDDIADLITYRALPTQHVDLIDPFLFLNHHGAQVYAPSNRGLPFGPHPHRGFETVTFILNGDIAHRDSGGNESIIGAGGMQWMTAGSGLVHSETSSAAFKAHGGPLEILQLWINLPARLKMTAPRYLGLQRDDIPVIPVETGSSQARVALVAGTFGGRRGPVDALTDIAVMTIDIEAGGWISLPVATDRNVFFYVVRGAVNVNGRPVEPRHLVAFSAACQHVATESIDIEAPDGACILFCHATPYHEPVVRHGPFVMNTRAEIGEAIADYQAGKLGV